MKRNFLLIILIGIIINSVAQIAPDKYYIQFTDKNNSPYSIGVEFDVTAPPEIGVSPADITLAAPVGETDQTLLTITNSGAGDLVFDLTDENVVEVYSWQDSDDVGGPALPGGRPRYLTG